MEAKTEIITFRVSQKELKIIEKKITKSGLNISEYLRRSALDQKIVVLEDLKKFVVELKPLRSISNNLNRLLILIHQERLKVININEISEIEELKEKVDEIWQLLNLLMGKIGK
ncbi:MAG: hypothetical protein WCZ27_09030 [Tissierellaceae bacterium]